MDDVEPVKGIKGWHTLDEMLFVDTLAKRPDAIRLLTGYLSAMKKRANSGRIDSTLVVRRAQRLLDLALDQQSSS